MQAGFIGLCIVAGCASTEAGEEPAAGAAAAETAAAEMVAAERAFAADVVERGTSAAFLASMAPGALTITNGIRDARNYHLEMSSRPDPRVQWRQSFVGVSRSGDFGFTTGPVYLGDQQDTAGHYLTIWRRQADGEWRWIFDHGVLVSDDSRRDAELGYLELAVSGLGAESAAAAVAEVTAAEALLASEVARNGPGALRALLADGALVKRTGLRPGRAPDDVEFLLQAPLNEPDFQTLIMEAAGSGDLVFTSGRVRWRDVDAGELEGFYARVWQLREDGWRVVYDHLSDAPRRSQ